MSDNKLFNAQGRLELLNEVTKEGMLSLEQTEIRGNEYTVFKDAPKKSERILSIRTFAWRLDAYRLSRREVSI